MVIDYIVEFTTYLNALDKGFNITTIKINRFFEMMADEELDFTHMEDVITIMKMVFCTNQFQYDIIEEYFQNYYLNKQNYEHLSMLLHQKQIYLDKQIEFTQTYYIQKQNHQDSINHLKQLLDEEFRKIVNEVYDHQEDYINITKPIINIMKFSKNDKIIINEMIDNNGEINHITLSDEQKSLMKDIFIDFNENALNIADPLFDSIKDKLVNVSEEALLNDDLALFAKMEKLFQIIDKLIKKINTQKRHEAKTQQQINDQLDLIIKEKQKIVQLSYDKEIEFYHHQLIELEKQHQFIQEELLKINEQIDNTKQLTMMIEKNESICHRESFIDGKNAVKANNYCIDEYTQKILDKDFNALSKQEKNEIYYFIKKNIMCFKTRITRQIHTSKMQKIDIQTTIQNTFKTGGLPLRLNYQKPKPNKTNLILILDVSGSCKEASQMMLTFMYILKSVFPRGCQTFAFVDSLYDISHILDAADIDTAIEKALAIIPRHGVYSNYFISLNSFWNEHRSIITSDSMVVVMGDGRNNRNPTGENIVKNIARRVKKAYWLNTESKYKWNQADSLASLYGKYFKMYEILNTNDLIHFVQSI
ncbi:MAG: VWA domain-containing protein [Erysipelotrichaceae bacterium]|nr:VWA domain-containing protein [Erysipelotrichaceae bacterium]